MAIVKRKSYPPISLNPFSLFVISSVAIHGLVLLGLVFKARSPITEREEPTPIDFVIVPPEESSAEPPPDTERQADKSSVAQGDVNPELPTASERVDSTMATPASPTVQPENPPPPVVPPTPPQPQVKPTPPPAPPKAIAETPPPNEVKPNPPVVKEPKPVTPPPVTEPEPVAKTPLLSGKDTSSLPKETAATATENPFQPDLPSKSEVRETLPPPTETPANATETPEPDPPSKPEPALPQPTETPPTATETPEPVSPVATNVAPKPTPIEPTPPENTSVPETPTSESATAVGEGAALLEGTQAKSSADSDSTFFAPEANASQQAANTSGVDARANVDLGPYLSEVKRRVKQNWQPTKTNDNRHTVLAFSIGRNGQIIGLRITQSSGSPQVDNEFLAAIQKSAPFAPLPANYPDSQLNIVYDLNINVYVE